MLRLKAEGADLWDSILPDELRKLPEELEHVNSILDDDRLMEPFVKRFSTTMGRPSVPVATYVRLMYIKFRYKLGYETLVAEVSDSIAWRRFCGIGYQQKVPDASTLIKLTHKYGDEILKELNDLIVNDLLRRKIVRGKKIRIDTTSVVSDIHYPTDSTLHIDALRRLRAGLQKIRGIGLRIGRTLKKVKGLNFTAIHLLRKTDQNARDKVKSINHTITRLTRKVVEKVKRVIHRIKDIRIRKYVEKTVDITEKVAAQSHERLAGIKPKERIVSMVDPDARPIVKGKLGRPVEFGRIAQITQDESGYFTQYGVFQGNPSESVLLPDIVNKHVGQFPGQLKTIAADTGFSSEKNYNILKDAGVKRIGIPARGKPPPQVRMKQSRLWFKRLRNFRAGIEAGIRFLDRKFSFKRSMFRGNSGTLTWVGWAVISANLYRFARGP